MPFPYTVCPLCQKEFRRRATVGHTHCNAQLNALRCPCGSWIAQAEDEQLLKMDFSTYSYDREEAWIMPYATRLSYERLVKSLSQFRQTNRWLDVGCGAGHLIEVAKSANWEVVGTELSIVAVRRLQEKGYIVYNALLKDLPEPRQSFDIVTLIEVLEHVPEPVDLLREVREFLRPGGCLYMTTPNARSLAVLLKGIEEVLRPPDHLWIWSPLSLRKLLLHTGFRPVKIWTDGLNPYRLLSRPAKSAPCNHLERTEHLRDISSRKPLFIWLKKITNFFLSVTSVGETLKVIAVKQ